MTSQEVTIEEVQTAILRRRDYGDYVSFVLSATSAIKAAGLSAESSLRFDLSAVDTLGLVPAVGRETTEWSSTTVRSSTPVREILAEGTEGNVFCITMPKEALEALPRWPGTDAIDWDDPPRLTVWAGNRLLAFELADRRSIEIDCSHYQPATD